MRPLRDCGEAALDVDRTRSNPQVDGDLRAEFQRGLDLAHAVGADDDSKKAAATDQRDGQVEGVVAFGKVEARGGGVAVEGQSEGSTQRDVRQAEDAALDGRQPERITSGNARRGDLQIGRIGKGI